MSASAPVPKDHPMMLAWEAHKESDEYFNSLRWAQYVSQDDNLRLSHPHVEGSLWALFVAGWQARDAEGKTGDRCVKCGEPLPAVMEGEPMGDPNQLDMSKEELERLFSRADRAG